MKSFLMSFILFGMIVTSFAAPLTPELTLPEDKRVIGFIRSHFDDWIYFRKNDNALDFHIGNPPTTSGLKWIYLRKIDQPFSIKSIFLHFPNVDNNLIRDPIGSIEITARVFEGRYCLTMDSAEGILPIKCANNIIPTVEEEILPDECQPLAQSCYSGGVKSQSLFNFSGSVIHCLTENLSYNFYKKNKCIALNEEITQTLLQPLPQFQEFIRNSVMAALTLYVMLYGMKLVMNISYVEKDQIVKFIMKFILVSYFAIGVGINKENEVATNGFTKDVLPFLLAITSTTSEMIFDASGSDGLCNFDRNRYESGYKFYSLWDSIDCRIGYYLGMQYMYGDSVGQFKSNYDNTKIDDKAHFFKLIFGVLLGGSIIFSLSSILFVFFLLSIVFYFISLYTVCIVTIYLMAYISPIFITFALFEQTKEFFYSWLKLTLSCALQPMIVGAAIAISLTIMDNSFFGSCEFKRINKESDYGIKYSVFELEVPETEPEASSCKSSLGWQLMNAYYNDAAWHEGGTMLTKSQVYKTSPEILWAMTQLLIVMFVMYFFMQKINEFASMLTSGPNMSSVAGGAMDIMSSGIAAAKALKNSNLGGRKKGGDLNQGGDSNQGGGKKGDDSNQGMKKGAEKAVDKVGTRGAIK